MTNHKKYELKFVNHDNKTKTVVVATIESTKHMEWIERENDEDSYLNWLVSDGKREMALKKHILKFVAEKYLTNSVNGTFADYKLVKICCKEDSKIVNLGNNRMKEIKCDRCKSIKFAKGQRPSNWLDMLNYNSRCFYHYFYCENTDSDAIHLTEIGMFQIPPTTVSKMNNTALSKTSEYNVAKVNVAAVAKPLAGTNIAINNNGITIADKQLGGNTNNEDHEKYMKYKIKYLKLKENMKM